MLSDIKSSFGKAVPVFASSVTALSTSTTPPLLYLSLFISDPQSSPVVLKETRYCLNCAIKQNVTIACVATVDQVCSVVEARWQQEEIALFKLKLLVYHCQFELVRSYQLFIVQKSHSK